ncbi:MAG: hypothetical protein M0Z66_12710 [Thermaerobacter sp.]|nr:hypothetical protein [Thermaerobacter sp.]
MRSAYSDGKRAYSLAYAALLRDREGPALVPPENRLRFHLRRIEKLANAFSGILVNS